MFIIDALQEFKYNGWYFTLATPKKIFRLESHLREKDKQEAMALTGFKTFHECLVVLVQTQGTIPVYLLMYKGEVMGMGGHYRAPHNLGVVWCVVTNEESKHSLSFLRFSRAFLPRLLNTYSAITNVVWLYNTKHVHYLNWLGATWKKTNSPDFAIFTLKDGGD